MVGSFSSGSIGPRPGHLVDDLVDEVFELLRVERDALGQHVLGDQRGDLPPHLAFRHLLDRREIDLLDQPAMQPHLRVEQLVAQRRDRRRRLRSFRSSASSATDLQARCFHRRLREAAVQPANGAAACAAAAASASAMRLVAVNRPNMLSAPPRACARSEPERRGLRGVLLLRRHDQLAQRLMDIVAGLHLVERHAAVDRLADEAEIVRDRGGERVAERLLDVGAAQAGSEQALLEAVDDHLERRPVGQPLADHVDQIARVLRAPARSSR